MTPWSAAVVAMVGVFVGYVLGYIEGWKSGTRDTERRWSDAVMRKADADTRFVTALPELPPDAVGATINGVYYSRDQYDGLRFPPGRAS